MRGGGGLFEEIVAGKACVGLLELQRSVVGWEVLFFSTLGLQTLPCLPLNRLPLGTKRWLALFLHLQTHEKHLFLKTTISLRSHHAAFTLPFLTRQPEHSRVSEHNP